MILFWVVAGVMSAAAAGVVLLRAAQAASQPEAADPTPVLYRRQLAEIDDLAGRGLIGESERRSAESEAGRRLLAASDSKAVAWSVAGGRGPALVAAVLAPALALGLYLVVGAPGAPDQPFRTRLSTWLEANPATLDAPEMAAVLHKLTRERPDDPEGYRFLALAEGASGNPAAAVRALHKAVRLAPERAELWEMLGEALVARDEGKVEPEAKDAFQKALARDPKAVAARFHLARVDVESGDRAAGLAAWRGLLADLPKDDPRAQAVQGAIAEAEGAPPPAPAFGEDQLAAIRGMVEGLAARLEANPEDPEGWVRLVRAYAVLGETERRDAALDTARARYAKNPQVLTDLDAAAKAEPMQ